MEQERDIIVIAGQTAVGKTTTFNRLTKMAGLLEVPYEPIPVSDFFYLLDETLIDDKAGGFNHYHNWCVNKKNGHNHKNGEDIIPFIVTSQDLIDNMLHKFFNDISSLSYTGKIWFVEWTGGININPPKEPASRPDVSFERLGKMFQEGSLPTEWVERIQAVIHPVADISIRYFLNERRTGYSLTELKKGTVSAPKAKEVIDMFGKDDFFTIENIFKDKDVQHIYYIRNNGKDKFNKDVREKAMKILEKY